VVLAAVLGRGVALEDLAQLAMLGLLDAARRFLEAGGRLSAVTLEGEPGIGKTRLLLEAAELAASSGFTCVAITADEEIRGPFLVARSLFASTALRDAVAGTPTELTVRRVVEAISGRDERGYETLSADAKLLRAFDLAGVAIREVASLRPLALFIDDVQWADDDTLRLLRYVVRSDADRPIFLLLTIRPDELASVTEAVNFIADMERMGLVRRARLGRFSSVETSELLKRVLGGPVEPASAASMQVQSEGVPFIVEELARTHREAGTLQQFDGVWRLGRNAIRDRFSIVVALAAIAALALSPIGPAGTFLLAGCIGVAVHHSLRAGLASGAVVAALLAVEHFVASSLGGLSAGPAPASDGLWDIAVDAIRKARAAGFRVTTNTTIFKETDPKEVVEMMGYLTDEVGIDGMLVAPGYQYSQIDPALTMTRDEHEEKFRKIREGVRKNGYRWLASPVYQDFLTGDRKLPCAPWGSVTRNPYGWKGPCYLLTDGIFPTYEALLDGIEWERYGPGNDHRCEHCGIHSGFEPSATIATTSSVKETVRSLAWTLR